MKNYMKKIIIGIFSLALFFFAQNAFAATWNGASNDCRGLSIANATTTEGFVNPCWPASSISADAGDTLNVRIYYHNTGTTTANNVKVNLSTNLSGSSTSKSFSGSINSDQGGLSLGTVTANISSSQTITFNSVKWYTNNTSVTPTALLGGQSGEEILNGGLNLGSVAPGWATQGSLVVSFHVSRTVAPELCKDTSATNYNGPLPCTYPQRLCLDRSASNYGEILPCVYPQTLCKDTFALNYNGLLPCRYPETNICSISDFTVSDTSIEEGDSVVLRWNTNNCTSVEISNIGDVAINGSKTVYPRSDITYTLTAYGRYSGIKTNSVKVYVDDDSYTNDNECYIDSFTASDTSIDEGDSVVLRWNTSGCDDVSISDIGDVSNDGSKTVYPRNDVTYTLRAYGDNNESKSIRIYVDDNYTETYNSNVLTTIATNVGETTAQINGLTTGSYSGNTYTYFEYGTTRYLGSKTTKRLTNVNSNFSEYLSGLSKNTTYYFQAVSNSNAGTYRGSINMFTTSGGTTTPTTIVKYVQGTTVTGSASPIMLQIENKYKNIGIGDVIDYTVYYKNIGKSKLTKPMLQVYVPEGITIINASEGSFSEDNRTLTMPLEDLIAGAEGTVYLQAKVNTLNPNIEQIVTTAALVYTNANGAQENAIAYVLNTQKNVNGNANLLGASVFNGNIFGLSLIGWLIFIIIILLLIIIARSFYSRKNSHQAVDSAHH